MKKRVVFIADKGFFSCDNIAAMEAESLHYIIPLHRINARKWDLLSDGFLAITEYD